MCLQLIIYQEFLYFQTTTMTQRISLSQLPTDRPATVLSFSSGRLEAVRLATRGFTPGARISMIQDFGRGPLIVTVSGTYVALGL